MENNNKNAESKKTLDYPVTPAGSLGLLATGYRGLIAWREAKKKCADMMPGGKDEPKKD